MDDEGTGTRTVRVYDDAATLARAAADRFVGTARSAIAARGRFYVALAGGSTPRALYRLLATPPDADAVDWSRTYVFWGDERCVPPTDAESNYGMARDELLARVPLREGLVFRMEGEAPDPAAAAARYEAELRLAFRLAPGVLPRFDLILLGMGPDGHTASLFPRTDALRVTDRLVTANRVEKLGATRLTLTLPVLDNAALVAFLVAGADKAETLAAVLEGPSRPDDLPSQRVATAHGAVLWLVDRAAAARLSAPPG
jgi:6-phosphogluconolactonase